MWSMQISRYMSHNETFSREPTWRSLGTLTFALPVWAQMEMPQSGTSCDYTGLHVRRGRSAGQMFGMVFILTRPPLSWFIMYQTSGWRQWACFISPAFEKNI